MSEQHTVTAFDEDINRLRGLVAEMGGRVETALEEAMDALVHQNLAKAKKVVLDDHKVDALEAEVEKLQAVVQSIPSATLSKRVRTILELQELDNPSIGGLPMLILQASSDNLIPWEAQRTLEACYPDASAHWIESPHLLFQRCPQECATHLVKFAESITAVA